MEEYKEAAEIIRSSKRILILTGAGMSADSGIPTFRDQEGFWNNFPVYKNKDYAPEILANGENFIRYPEECWAFYEWRRRNAQKNSPHEGYDFLNKILEEFDSFIFTTNTDGYHLRSGCPEDKICETHGSLWRLQFLDGKDNYVEKNEEVPLCFLDEELMLSSDLPEKEGKILRPNIRMFNDGYHIRNDDQDTNYYAFNIKKVDSVILIGSDCQIPTNIDIARKKQNKGSKIICINPNKDCCGGYLKPDIFIKEKAKKALMNLDEILHNPKNRSYFILEEKKSEQDDEDLIKTIQEYVQLKKFVKDSGEKNISLNDILYARKKISEYEKIFDSIDKSLRSYLNKNNPFLVYGIKKIISPEQEIDIPEECLQKISIFYKVFEDYLKKEKITKNIPFVKKKSIDNIFNDIYKDSENKFFSTDKFLKETYQLLKENNKEVFNFINIINELSSEMKISCLDSMLIVFRLIYEEKSKILS